MPLRRPLGPDGRRITGYPDGRGAAANLLGDGGPTINETRFTLAVLDQIHAAADAKEPVFSGARKIKAACNAYTSILVMRDDDKKKRKALARYEAMMTRPNVRQGLRAAFADAGFAPVDAHRNLAQLASGRAKTIVVTEREDGEGNTSREVKTTEHPPNIAALKVYYEMTHDPPVQRTENLNVNLDVMKAQPPVPVEIAPRAVGELGPATNGAVNVFAEEPDPDGDEPDDDDAPERPEKEDA